MVCATRTLVGRLLVGVIVGAHRGSAGPAADDALTQCGTLPWRPGPGVGAVGGQLGLVGQVVVPADVAAVVVVDQHRPFGAGPLDNAGVHAAVGIDGAPRGVAAVHICPGVAGILQHSQHAGVGETTPAQLPGPGAAVGAQRKPAAGERGDHTVGRTTRGERGEQVTDRGLDLGIGVEDHLAGLVVDEADRQRGPQLPARGGGLLAGLQPLRHHVQLHLAHRGLQPQQHPVVDIARIVDAIGVDQQRLGDRGELHQPRDLGVGAGQPGDLDPEDRPDPPRADPTHQLGETLPDHAEPTRNPQVGVDHHHVAAVPAQPHGLLGQPVLACRGLGVLAHLGHRRLPQVDHREPVAVAARDLGFGVHRLRLPGSPSPYSPAPQPLPHARTRPEPTPARQR